MSNADATDCVPVSTLAPLDYRYALDAAMPILAASAAVAVRCNLPALTGEVRQRLPVWAAPGAAHAALWVEPIADTWQAELRALASDLPASAPLIIIASQPLAHMLPERQGWPGHPLGLELGGVSRLRRVLLRAGFALEPCYGIHSALSIGISFLSGQAARWGRPEIADRLHFAARLRYCSVGPLAPLATVALLIATRGQS